MGARTPRTSDRRVERTRRLLREALIALMLERGWDAISVQDICERADVGRSTFYTHFADKEDLLVGGLDDLRKALRRQRTAAAGHPLPFARGLIEHAHENQRLFRALVGKRSGQVVMTRFRQLIVELVGEDLAGHRAGAERKGALVHFIAGGFLELLTWWLETRSPLSPGDMEERFLEMAAPVLKV